MHLRTGSPKPNRGLFRSGPENRPRFTRNVLFTPIRAGPPGWSGLRKDGSFAGSMIPGQSGVRTINVTLENGKGYTHTHPTDIDLQPGRYTPVNLVLGRDRIKADNKGISEFDWEENGTAIDGGEINADYSHDSNTKTTTIYSGEGLKVAVEVVNGGRTDINMTLDKDIDHTGKKWMPIGNHDKKIHRAFDGKSKVITGLTFNQPGTNNIGRIGRLGENGMMQNVKLDKVNIKANNNVGEIVGNYIGDSMIDCSVSGDISCYRQVGGVAGVSTGSLGIAKACYWSGSPDAGIGADANDDETTKVDGTTTWNDAIGIMNTALNDTDRQYELTGTLPALKKQ